MSQHGGETSPNARLSDSRRIQRVLDELGSRGPDNRIRPFAVMDEKAKTILMEYAIELTSSIIEASSVIARHRDSTVVDVEDINLILGEFMVEFFKVSANL